MAHQVHWTVTCEGQGYSEFGDRRINPPDQWAWKVHQASDAWSAILALPLRTLAPHDPGTLGFHLIRCAAAEGITSWPTPFAGWMHAHREAFVPLCFAALEADALEQRCHELRRAVHGTCHSFPNDVPDWHQQMAKLLKPDLEVDQLAEHVHQHARTHARRTFMDQLDRLNPMQIDQAELIEAIDALDADDRDRLRELAGKWGIELLNRGEPMMIAAYVYQQGGDEALAARVRLSLQRMIERWPIQVGLQRVSEGGQWASSLNIYPMGLAIRTLHMLSARAPQDQDLLLRLLKLAHEVIYFGEQTVANAYHFNHSINWADKVVEIAALCPYMRASEHWLELGWHHMRHALKAQILPDGVSQELCSGYNLVAYMRLTEAIQACEDSQLVVPADILDKAEEMLCAGTVYLLPNGAIAGFSDGYMGCDQDGYVHGPQSIHRHLIQGGRRFNRADLLWLGTQGAQGQPPTHTDDARRWAGVYACRTGWTSRDQGLILDAGPLGRAHAHDDRLNFVYSYKERCLLVDGHYDMQQRRMFTCGPTAHSTVCVDGYKSDYIGNFDKWVNRKPQEDRCERVGDLYYLEAHHHLLPLEDEGEGEREPISVHRRIIAQLDRFICVIDHVAGGGRHNIHSRLQLPRGEVVLDGARFHTTTGKIDLAGMHLNGAVFEQDPGNWAKGPDQQVTLRTSRHETALPFTQAVLLMPFEDGKLSWPKVSSELSAGACTIKIHWPDTEVQQLTWPSS